MNPPRQRNKLFWKQTSILISLLLFFPGCSFYQISSEEISSDFYPSKSSKNDVQYIENIKKTNRPYKVIGSVTVNTERNKKRELVLDQLKRQAALVGGDAITNVTTNDGTGLWAKNKPRWLLANANIRINYVAQVIVLE